MTPEEIILTYDEACYELKKIFQCLEKQAEEIESQQQKELATGMIRDNFYKAKLSLKTIYGENNPRLPKFNVTLGLERNPDCDKSPFYDIYDNSFEGLERHIKKMVTTVESAKQGNLKNYNQISGLVK